MVQPESRKLVTRAGGKHIMSSKFALGLGSVAFATSAHASVIRPEAETLQVQPGSSFALLWLLEDAQTPLVGYSLQLLGNPGTGSSGEVIVDLNASNFYESRNLITAAGGEIDPTLSLIERSGSSGVFVNAMATGLSPFAAVPGVNDVLAEIVWNVSADASGEFLFSVGPVSVLSDEQGSAVPFEARSVLITVVPGPATAASLLVMFAMQGRRRATEFESGTPASVGSDAGGHKIL